MEVITEEPTMDKLLVVSALAALVAGCATQGDTQLAKADCKVAPITTASVAGKYKQVSPIEQRYAEMQLASTDYRRRQLAERGLVNNNVEEALRDCY
jgi:uncharacterized lipoprotein YajG